MYVKPNIKNHTFLKACWRQHPRLLRYIKNCDNSAGVKRNPFSTKENYYKYGYTTIR